MALVPVIPSAAGVLCAYGLGVNATTAGFVLLIAILLLAASWGLPEAVVASFAAALCFNYYLLPRFTGWPSPIRRI